MNAAAPVYLLVEEAFRELAARVRIGVHCLAGGHPVLIGQQWWFFANASRLPPGVMLLKGNNDVQTRMMARIKQFGHKTASIEEEAFGLAKCDNERLFADNADANCDLFLVQGTAHKEFLETLFPTRSGGIEVTGNPRVDVLRGSALEDREPRKKDIQSRFGRFALVNTNYGQINPHDRDCLNYFHRCLTIGTYQSDDPKDAERFQRMMTWERKNFDAMVSLIAKIRQTISDLPIVIRPHPSEWVERWEQAYDGTDGVYVVRDPDYLSWIETALVTMHTSCTTGLEAFLLGARALSLTPGSPNLNESFLSNHTNPCFMRPEEAVNAIAKLHYDNDPGHWNRAENAESWKPYLSIYPTVSSAQRIADALCQLPTSLGRSHCLRQAEAIEYMSVPLSGDRARKISLNRVELELDWRKQSRQAGIGTTPEIRELGASVFLIQEMGV